MASRLPAGHPEAFFEAFANVYSAAFDDIVTAVGDADAARKPARRQTVYPNVYDGREGVRFISQCVASSQAKGAWLPMEV